MAIHVRVFLYLRAVSVQDEQLDHFIRLQAQNAKNLHHDFAPDSLFVASFNAKTVAHFLPDALMIALQGRP